MNEAIRMTRGGIRPLLVALVVTLYGTLAGSLFADDEPIPLHMVDALVERRDSVKGWATTCPSGPHQGSYSTMVGTCWQGDMTCFAGLSCLAGRLAGDDAYADARARDVLSAQEESGRWVRGPMWKGLDYADGHGSSDPSQPDFSRDQTRGVFGYLWADGYISQDPARRQQAVRAAEEWLDWMQANGERLCLDDTRTCELTVGTNNMAYNTLRLIGVLPRPVVPMTRNFYRSKWYYGIPFLAEIRTLRLDETFRDKWYPRHLKWWRTMFYRIRNMDPISRDVKSDHWARMWGKAARRIYRGDPENPLYRLGCEGVTVDLVTDVLDTYTHASMPTPDLNYRDWAWQRHTSERAWERSDGHDQICLLNLVLAKIMGRVDW